MNIIKEEVRDVKDVFERFIKKDFSGKSGNIIKNSSYQLSTNLIAKLGSLFFTIVIARMLGVELFGLYTLALSTIILFSFFSDLGITVALITFVSKNLGQKNLEKARAYFKGLFKYKIYLLSISSIILASAGFILVNYYYNKQIYYAILAGVLYIPCLGLTGYLGGAFQATNNFRVIMIREIIIQVSRFVLVPLGIFYLLKTSLEKSIIVAIIILIITFCYFLSLLYLRAVSKKEIKFLRKRPKNLTTKEKKELKKFILPLTLTAISGMFFGYIDTLMLGHYVDVTHIGFYGATFALIGAASTIIGFLPGVLLPVFSRIKRKSLIHIFGKVRNFTILMGTSAFVFTFILARYVLLIYGNEFMQAIVLLKIFSLLLITAPLSGLYDSYLTSMKKTSIIAKLVVVTTMVNIILNFLFIKYGLQFGMMQAVMGACIATVLSRITYLVGIIYISKPLTHT